MSKKAAAGRVRVAKRLRAWAAKADVRENEVREAARACGSILSTRSKQVQRTVLRLYMVSKSDIMFLWFVYGFI